MVNFVQFANDECDYGMGLELGIDLFCHGSKYVVMLLCLKVMLASLGHAMDIGIACLGF